MRGHDTQSVSRHLHHRVSTHNVDTIKCHTTSVCVTHKSLRHTQIVCVTHKVFVSHTKCHTRSASIVCRPCLSFALSFSLPQSVHHHTLCATKLQCLVVRCRVMRCEAVRCCVVLCDAVLQYVAVCCSVLRCKGRVWSPLEPTQYQ